jgi:acetyl/propionyl-CoA carboxylase alpha subunit
VKLHTYKTPQGYGVRVDDSFEAGMEIPIHYDPMIAKLITFGKTREEAIARMIRAIDDYQITGIETTLQFGKYVMQHPAFIEGHFDTKFIEKYYTPDQLQPNYTHADVAALAASLLFNKEGKKANNQSTQNAASNQESNWLQNRKNY